MADDESPYISGAVTGAAGLFALGAILGSGVGEYARDLATAIGNLFGRGGLEAALREERAQTMAEVLALAVIADGAITEDEHEAVKAFAKGHGVDPDEALAKVVKLALGVRDPVFLREKIARTAASLTPNERLDLFVAVKNLAHRGSAAWPAESGYRGGSPTPDALITIFREGLGIQSSG